MLKVVTVPNKILSSPTRRVTKIDGKIKKLIYEMEKTLAAQINPPGVGLAAPQIGENLALFIMKPKKNVAVHVFINPKIIKITDIEGGGKNFSRKKKKTPLEGCLSIPKIWSSVKRAQKVLLRYQNLTCQVRKGWFTGFEAMIIQHEIDHLNGILFTQRALEQKRRLYEEKEGKLEKLDY